jgi:hypothetical protein
VKSLSRWSRNLAPFDSLSKGEEWRLNMKTGDFIDGYDTTKLWYASTIVDIATKTNAEGQVVPMVNVGFRRYHENGTREDLRGKKFYGWGERFDEWLPAYTSRIQPNDTYPKKIDSQGIVSSVTEGSYMVDDRHDPTSPEPTPFALQRQGC